MWVILVLYFARHRMSAGVAGFGQEPGPCRKDACIAPLSAPCISLPCSAAWTNRRRRLCRERSQTSRGFCCWVLLSGASATTSVLAAPNRVGGKFSWWSSWFDGLQAGNGPAPVRALLVPVSLVGRCWCMPHPVPLISQKDFPEF